ncbi:hypothetical protein N5C96_27110 [Delftia tsuruhatensis]|uniref:hypothetical protein n=1 Tax=Delftia tsuruhatensis TaxID=180282 RepID=UPI002443ED50|nr:hypothetical protein [Delftia tsuruhatensis]MDH0777090.1 hypothetical protein [Delftia tsuruhatensis]MDH1460579.1 hypothetical protein [Delftia tsuruhatensis]MDH1826694.1 hypothetical protein [Delftia tsuruhatensis]WGG13845.1 hypothetical protein N5O86_14815 [Delftia tsuruhatensis]
MKIRFKEVQPGDILGIYIGNGCYAYMRLLYMIAGHTYLCEVFEFKSTKLEFTEEILHANQLTPLVSANWKAYLDPKFWHGEVVHRDNSFTPPIDRISDARLMNVSQIIKFNMNWTPNSDQMLIIAEDVWDEEKHAALSKKHANLELYDNPEKLICEIRNKLKLKPTLDYKDRTKRMEIFNWLKNNKVYLG